MLLSQMMFSWSTRDVSTFLENIKLSQMVKCQADGDKQQETLTKLGEWAEKTEELQHGQNKVTNLGKKKANDGYERWRALRCLLQARRVLWQWRRHRDGWHALLSPIGFCNFATSATLPRGVWKS